MTVSNETTDISSEIEKIAKEGQAEKTGARKFRFPDFTIFLWGWFFISLILLMVIAWNYLQNSVYDQGVRTGAQNTAAQIYTDMINKAANDQCNTIFVQYENRRVDLINVRCLQILNQNNAASDAAATEQKTEKK
jgi:hypothetical protein